jgi:serine/threonine protein kinase
LLFHVEDYCPDTLSGVEDRSERPLTLADRYQLIKIIGSGGSATVWQASDERLGRAVAVKVLLPGLSSDPTFQRRFEREARHFASLKSANVVKIFDAGSSPEGPFIVMELIHGESLRERLDRTDALTTVETVTVAKDILTALIQAHRNGLIHRDIKPSNILIDSEGTAKLTDFGISRSLAETTEITAAGMFTGTIAYSSPEQLIGESVGEASDLYSLGCVLYECLRGHPPFVADDISRLAFQQRFADPPPISDPMRTLSPGLVDCIMRVLQKAPAQRYESASAMLEAIDRSIPSQSSHRIVTPTAPNPSGPNRNPRLRPTRNEASAGVALHRLQIVVMVMVLLIAAGIIAWHPWVQTRDPSNLSSGASLQAGGSLVSPNDRYQLVMQSTGDLTLKLARSGEPIWATGSEGHPDAYATMQRDGNFAIYDRATSKASSQSRIPLYQTRTSGHTGADLRLLDDGNIVIRDSVSGRLLWQAGSGPASLGSTLISTQGLHPLQSIRSPNGAYELTNNGWSGQMRLSAVSSPNCPSWVEPAAGLPASVSALLPDGEFVMLAPLARQTWTSTTNGYLNAELVLGDDGTLRLVSTTGTVIWEAPATHSESPGCLKN